MPEKARKWVEQHGYTFDDDLGPTGTMVAHLRRLLTENEKLREAAMREQEESDEVTIRERL